MSLKREKTEHSGGVVGKVPLKLWQRRGVPRLPMILMALLIGAGGTYAIIKSLAATPASASVISFARTATGTNADFTDVAGSAGHYQFVVVQSWRTDILAELKAANPAIKVLAYYNLTGMSAPSNGVYSGCVDPTNAPEAYFLHNLSGQRFAFSDFTYIKAANQGNSAYQQACANHIVSDLASKGFDGAMLDDTNYSIKYHYTPSQVQEYPTDAQYGAATKSAVAYIGPKVQAAGKLILPNMGGTYAENADFNDSLLQYVSGAYDEFFTAWPGGALQPDSNRARAMQSIATAESEGKYYVANAPGSSATDTKTATYGLASEMLVANGHASFGFNAGSYDTDAWLPIFDTAKTLGAPKAAYYMTGSVQRRDFANGTVLANPTTTTQTVSLGGTYSGPGLTNVTSVTMPAQTGLVLTGAATAPPGGTTVPPANGGTAGNTNPSSSGTVTAGCTKLLAAGADLQTAVNGLRAGDTLCLAAGITYNSTELDFRQTTSGTAGAPIVITSQDPSDPATITGRIVFFANNNYITLSHLKLNASKYVGSASTLTNGADHTSIIYDDVTNNHTSICVNDVDTTDPTYGVAHNTVIDHDRIHDCGQLPPTNQEHGVYESGFNAQITNNYIYANADRGIQLRGAQGAIVEHNIVDNNGEGVIFGDLDSSNNTVDHNIFSNSNIRFNVEYNWGDTGVGTGNTFRDNCVWSTVSGYYGGGQSIQPGLTGVTTSNTTFVDPQYVDVATHNYNLQPTSSCEAQAPLGGSTTPPPPTDTTKPTVSFSSPANGATVSGTVTATAAASDNVGVSKVEFSLDGTLKMTDTSSSYNYSFDSKALATGPHTLSAKAYDAANNTTTSTITLTVNNPDTTPPSAPTNLKATAANATTVNLSWTASTDTGTGATGVTKYSVLRNGIVIAQPTTTTYTDTGRTANTSYSYTVQAVDGAGNVSGNSGAATAMTPGAIDTTAPTTPGSLKATAAGTTQVNLTWTASTDSGGSGLAGYNVYRNGAKLNSTPITTNSYGDTTVVADLTYNYQVEAVDGSGNKSAKTSAVNVTTPTVKPGDITGPASVPDGKIDLSDVSYVIRHYNTNDPSADITGPNGSPDGKVDIYDLSYIIRNYGK